MVPPPLPAPHPGFAPSTGPLLCPPSPATLLQSPRGGGRGSHVCRRPAGVQGSAATPGPAIIPDAAAVPTGQRPLGAPSRVPERGARSMSAGSERRAVAPPGVMPAPRASKVELRLSCRHLLDRDPLTKSDPSVVLLLLQSQSQWVQVGAGAAAARAGAEWVLGAWSWGHRDRGGQGAGQGQGWGYQV